MNRSQSLILLIVVLISVMGVLSIYSSTHQKDGRIWEDIYKRQIAWIVLGLFCFFIAANTDYRRLWDWTYFLYFAALFFLMLVFIFGITRLGAQRWLKLAWFNFQPSELAKIAMVVFWARYFSKKSAHDTALLSGRFGIFRGLILPFLFAGAPMALIVEQPDLGSGLMILFLFTAMLYLTDVKLRYIIIFLLVFTLPLPLFWHFLRDYQKERILVFMNPNIDPLGAGYTIIQSKIAIGSGGFFGKGWLAGTQSQLHFLPEAHTDFIFATFAEERGVFGSLLLLFLYFSLVRQCFIIGRRTRDYFGRLLAFGISLTLGMQVFINIAMNLGLAPVVGLPLPLMSYGGSSLLITFASLGVVASISKRRAVF